MEILGGWNMRTGVAGAYGVRGFSQYLLGLRNWHRCYRELPSSSDCYCCPHRRRRHALRRVARAYSICLRLMLTGRWNRNSAPPPVYSSGPRSALTPWSQARSLRTSPSRGGGRARPGTRSRSSCARRGMVHPPVRSTCGSTPPTSSLPARGARSSSRRIGAMARSSGNTRVPRCGPFDASDWQRPRPNGSW